MFLSLRFWVTGSFNVAIPTLDSREAPYSGPFREEKQRPGVEGGKERPLTFFIFCGYCDRFVVKMLYIFLN